MSSAIMETSRPALTELVEYHGYVRSCAHCSECMILVARLERSTSCLFVFQCPRCDHVESKDRPATP
jgi:hypothetical protein